MLKSLRTHSCGSWLSIIAAFMARILKSAPSHLAPAHTRFITSLNWSWLTAPYDQRPCYSSSSTQVLQTITVHTCVLSATGGEPFARLRLYIIRYFEDDCDTTACLGAVYIDGPALAIGRWRGRRDSFPHPPNRTNEPKSADNPSLGILSLAFPAHQTCSCRPYESYRCIPHRLSPADYTFVLQWISGAKIAKDFHIISAGFYLVIWTSSR